MAQAQAWMERSCRTATMEEPEQERACQERLVCKVDPALQDRIETIGKADVIWKEATHPISDVSITFGGNLTKRATHASVHALMPATDYGWWIIAGTLRCNEDSLLKHLHTLERSESNAA